MDRLASKSKAHVRHNLLPYSHQWIDDEDISSVVKALRSDWISQGPKVNEFEQKLANYCGAKYTVVFSSGTAALHAVYFVADKIIAKHRMVLLYG